MDYLVFSLIVLAVLAVCLYLVRLPGEIRLTRKPAELAERAQERRQQEHGDAPDETLPQRKTVLSRELKKIPVPWGWPGSNAGRGADGGAFSLKGWVDHLVAQKRTVDDPEFRRSQRDALRSMVEDRYGHAPRPGQVTYRKVKPPRLQDPSRPPDQMDNFPSGRTEVIVKKLSRQPGRPHLDESDHGVRKASDLGRIKKPWGW